MFKQRPFLFSIAVLSLLVSGCVTKVKESKPILLKVEDAAKNQLLEEVNRFAKVDSMRAKMDFDVEDNSLAALGKIKTYTTADSEVVIQRPAKIYLKVEVPIVKIDITQMTSDGEKFRVAVLQPGDCGDRCKRFLIGTNNADYSKLQRGISEKELKDVDALANIRPQHITDAVLVRPADKEKTYLQSSISQVEEDETQKKNSPLRKVIRGYYLLDELKKDGRGDLKIVRRFWFDRVGGIRLARQQVFDEKGEIESDIVYGREGNLGSNGEYNNLPLRIRVTRPKEKYTISLTYQSPQSVSIGKQYQASAFELKNTWNLPEIDLDQKLQEANGKQALINK